MKRRIVMLFNLMDSFSLMRIITVLFLVSAILSSCSSKPTLDEIKMATDSLINGIDGILVKYNKEHDLSLLSTITVGYGSNNNFVASCNITGFEDLEKHEQWLLATQIESITKSDLGFSEDTDWHYFCNLKDGNSSVFIIKSSNPNILEKDFAAYYDATPPTPTPIPSKFDEYIAANEITLTADDIMFDYANSKNKEFILKGKAELSNYYNYGYSNAEANYFCIKVTPFGGKISDQWYIYCHRESLSSFFEALKNKGAIEINAVCKVSLYKDHQSNMASLIFVNY